MFSLIFSFIYFILSSSSTVPVAPPTGCINITFLPLSATLNWTAPVLIDQNGAPVGYNLACTSDTDGIAVNGLNATKTSTKTTFAVTDVMPFTAYTCELRFINVIGQGPPTQCRFKTAEFSKWLKYMYNVVIRFACVNKLKFCTYIELFVFHHYIIITVNVESKLNHVHVCCNCKI